MEKFDRFSLFPAFIDLPLRHVANKVIKSQNSGVRLDTKLKSAYRIAAQKTKPYSHYGTDKLQLSHISPNDRFKKYCSIKLDDRTLVSGNAHAVHADSVPNLDRVDYFEKAQESLEALGKDDLQAILATVLELINK